MRSQDPIANLILGGDGTSRAFVKGWRRSSLLPSPERIMFSRSSLRLRSRISPGSACLRWCQSGRGFG